ncbi:12065_t:CDS:2, partial [Entrophospora sp. SA101]
VIYGDIGTSPLYTINTIFTSPPNESDVLGAVSLIIWSLTILPMIKYIFIILRADDNGMGGTFALYSLICRHSGLSVRENERSDDLTIMNYDSKSIHSLKEKKNIIARSKFVQDALLILVLLGASLIMSDGLLTPAISVMSAVEGMSVPAPSLTNAIVPLSCAIIVLLFIGQKFGTSVIYGDIGTSPLYTINTIFTSPPADENDVLGAVSLIIWSLTILPMIKYIFIILRADDNGMGGTFALYSLICRHSGLSVRENERSDDLTIMNYDSKSIHSLKEKKNIIARSKFVQDALLILVLLGASLIMSDGLLTPAISVMSAVEGMSVPAPSLTNAIVPLSCAIIVLLFIGQKFGTSKMGALFAPIVSLWFLSLAIIGAWNIAQYPQVLKAFNPQYAFEYFIRNGEKGYDSLGGVLLAVTGVEALYADLGHFSKKSIQLSFPFFVYVPLILAYSGQAGRLILEPKLIDGPLFWLTIPQNQVIYWIVFVLATLATIIASQAMITATFSLIHQAMQLDCFPRVRV